MMLRAWRSTVARSRTRGTKSRAYPADGSFADDVVNLAVQLEGLPLDRPTAALGPQAMGQNGDLVASGDILTFEEEATLGGAAAEHVEELGGDGGTGHGLGIAVARGEAHRGAAKTGEIFEGGLAFAPIEEIRRRRSGDLSLGGLLRPLAEEHQAVGLLEWQGTVEKTIDQAEDDDVPGDRQGERADREHGHREVLLEGTQRKAEVLP